jgi:hypothetical protein
VRADVVEPERHGIADELSEHAAARRQRPDGLALALVDAQRDESLECGARRVEHAERGVPRACQLARGLHDSLEHRVDVEVAEHAPGERQQDHLEIRASHDAR